MPQRVKENTFLGILYFLAGTILFSLADATGKWLTASYPVIQIAWLRSIIGLVLIALFAIASGRIQQLKTTRPAWHLLRAVLGALAIFFIFYGLKHIPISEYVSLTFAAPLILALLSPWVLHERVPKESWLAIIFGFIGVLIILRPTPDHFHIAHLAALGVAFAIAGLGITARLLARTESAVALNFYLYPLNILLGAYWAITGWTAPGLTDWALFLGLGICATIALGCFIQALRYAMPARVMPIDYARMLWMLALGYLVWGEVPAALTWAGIAIIMISGIYVVSHGKKLPELEVSRETRSGGL